MTPLQAEFLKGSGTTRKQGMEKVNYAAAVQKRRITSSSLFWAM
jgi:hypothetical protein